MFSFVIMKSVLLFGFLCCCCCCAYVAAEENDVDTFFDERCKNYYDKANISIDYPHMVQIGYDKNGTTVWSCIGSLISENLVLTSAYCAKSFIGPAIRVRLGTNNFKENPSDIQEIDVASQLLHPDYVKSVKHDLGVLVLKKNVDLNERVRPICFQSNVKIDDINLIGTGWGKPSLESSASDDLKVVELKRYANEECTEKYKETEKKLDFTTEFCAAPVVEERDICTGDGGGPIQIKHPNYEKAHLQIGITWYGPTLCGQPEYPSVYVYVPYYISWIKDVITSNKIA